MQLCIYSCIFCNGHIENMQIFALFEAALVSHEKRTAGALKE
jgi:hypothetical protein